MDPQTLVIVLRMAERILGICLGGLLIYFAYRLFVSLPGKASGRGGSGEFSVAGGTKIKLARVGPGVFFALFGAGLVAFSLFRPVSFTKNVPVETSSETAAPLATTTTFMGATMLPETDEDRLGRRVEVGRNIRALNQALARASAADQTELNVAVARAKLALMEPLWAEDWGDLADFRAWLEKGGTPPQSVQPAAEFFLQQSRP